ncbi:hypothetical protein Taro_048312 [Colocasia esculenta]|uniref:GBF-interacting protein 1 N-terminal domain-containing protein n=1 Tax=Colocasia esculenta TaxID=4460 RepID=A0A843X2M1_COLES|nr:hypothetical protein [Colocasia esculenta]
MSGSAGGGRAAGGGAGATTASATTKMLQNIKEIVGGSFPEVEIRAMLKECNMDPGETIHRLLNQDTFHEVKSKREKKKETKDNGESRTRGVNNSLIPGARGVVDYSGRMGSTQGISSGTRSKPMQRRDNGPSTVPIFSVLGSGPGESGVTRSSAPQSSSVVPENTGHLPATADTISSQYSAGIGSAWTGVPGQRTLADIVKMGRPPSKTIGVPFAQTESCTVHNSSTSKELYASADSPTSMVLPSESHHEDPISNVSEIVHEPGSSVSQEKSLDEWPSIAQIGHSLSESDDPSAVFTDQPTSSNLLIDGANLGHYSGQDKRHSIEDGLDDDNLAEDSGRHVAASDRHPQVNTPVEESCNDVSVDIPSTMPSLQQLNLHEEVSVTQADDNPAVIFPNNLQITNSECSHLSFGSFRSGISASFSESLAPNMPNCNLEVPPETTDDTAIEHSDARDPEYYSSEQLRPLQNENVDPTPSTNSENYEIPSSHPDVIRVDSSDATEQAYTSSSTSDLLRSAVQPAQEFDLPYSSLLAAQSTTNYNPSVSSISVPSIAMLEGLDPGAFSTAQPPQHNLPATVPTGPAVPQPLSVQSYAQPTLPLGHFANLIGYPFLPQSYAYMPSAAFQQAYTGNSAYNQAPAAVNAGIKYTLPQFKTNVAIPQAAVVSSGLGGFGSSTNILGNFALNPSASSANTTTGYDGMSSSQYKDENHFVRPQQNESPAIWLNEGGSRTMSSLAARTYYGLQRQNQLSGGIRQSQQLSPYGAVGYQNPYQSQAGVPQEHRQNSVDGGLSARGPASQMGSQIWQHNY